jgi:hypothetical protein
MGKHSSARPRATGPRRTLPPLVLLGTVAVVVGLVTVRPATGSAPAVPAPAAAAPPVVTTLLGGTRWDEATGVAVDAAGNRYVSGSTTSGAVPGTRAVGPGGLVDAFVAELSPTGALRWEVVLGGSGVDTGQGVAVGRDGVVYLAGRTGSADFPVLHALQPRLAGRGCPDAPCSDAFVARFGPDGPLLSSTYLGGSLDEEARGIAVDGRGSAYVVGNTTSTDLPTVSAFQARAPGSSCPGDLPCPGNVFVSKLGPDASSLVWSTYLGGSQEDTAAGIAVSPDGTAFVAGTTRSSDFPVTGAPRPPTGTACGPPPGVPCPDVFVTALAPDGASARYSTLLGGSGQERAGGIAVDTRGRAVVAGSTQSTDFPTARPAQAATGNRSCSPSEQCSDAFVTRLGADGTPDLSTYLGGSADDAGLGVAVDAAGDIHATGRTDSRDLPTRDPVQPDLAGRADAFVVTLSGADGALVRGSYLGGTDDDRAKAVAAAPDGSVVVAGRTVSADFPGSPARPGAPQREDDDAFLTTLR